MSVEKQSRPLVALSCLLSLSLSLELADAYMWPSFASVCSGAGRRQDGGEERAEETERRGEPLRSCGEVEAE